MRTYKRNVIELDEGDEVTVTIRGHDGMHVNAAVTIARVGNDDDDFPLKTPFLQLEMGYPWGKYSCDPGKEGAFVPSIIRAPHCFLVTGTEKD